MMQAQPQHGRKTITRSRAGCAVCKSKRLKCDEARPACSRCKRLGIPCPGYSKQLKWMKSESTPAPAEPGPVSPQPPVLPVAAPPMFDFNESLDPAYTDFSTLHSFQTFPSTIETPTTLDDFTSRSSDLQFTEDLALRSPPSNQPPATQQQDEEWQGVDKSSTWLDSILKNTDTENMAIAHRRPSSRRGSRPQDQAQLPSALQDHTSILVEYYFKEVCGMMSCYDSQMNPYRTAISNAWASSPALYYVVQSMAAACLSDVCHEFSAVGRRLLDQSVRLVAEDMKPGQPLTTPTLMALVMLGFSMSWHDAGSLGQAEYELLSKALLSIETQADGTLWPEKQKQVFFYNSLVYWRMLLSFVTDTEPTLPITCKLLPQPEVAKPDAHVPPHPQTGIGIEVQELVAQVGKLVRRERKRIRSRQSASRIDIEQAQAAIRIAEQLQRELCAVTLPSEASVMNSGDDMTPTSHLLQVAEAYRLAGLLQLYRNFPDLLISRLSPSPDIEAVADSWLTRLALHINDMVQDIPITSRSKSIQPLLLVCICSELSLHRKMPPLEAFQSPAVSLTTSPRFLTTPTPSITDVLHARRTSMARLSFFKNMLAAKPIQQMMTLVQETWAYMDRTRTEIYWMDVMLEKGYETLMG
ncbi:hypothetical protein NLU13_0959 [Sarocladium strictum]|uniref:Zn(2)-C6 fungal-type domain-containing protein n=1 Tax=Sarocladium strictum TaxID=5046 RepID=A0AA39LBS2_SARSR|nr:hypothetical protein NLU13_0959 [Sarocladium strictum]